MDMKMPVTVPEGIEMMRTVEAVFKRLDDHEELPEIMGEIGRLPPDVFAQLLMEHGDVEVMTMEHKKWLMYVAAYMGPDWLEALRRDVAFMIKVEAFR